MEQILSGGMLTGDCIHECIKSGKISIIPFNTAQLNPNSYNLTLANKLKIYTDKTLDYNKKNETYDFIIPEEGLVLHPGTLYIGSTNEKCGTDYFIPMLDGRSSIGRLGINVHICAGFGDIGFCGTWTLEITAVHPVRIYPNMEICQTSFFNPCGNIKYTYAGRYQSQNGPVESKSYEVKKVYENG